MSATTIIIIIIILIFATVIGLGIYLLSKICIDFLGIKIGCRPTIPDFQNCSSNAQCLSGKCAAVDDGPDICCPGGEDEYCAAGATWYCKGLKAGMACHDSCPGICASGSCVNGKCVGDEKLPDYSNCNSNSQCLSGKCSQLHGQSSDICCPGGKDETCDAGNYCSGLKSGMACHDSCPGTCASGSCVNGICVDKLPDYSNCNSNSQCASGKCSQLHGQSSDICCPGGKDETCDAGNYCSGLKTGMACHDSCPGTCASDSCVNGKCR